jgi:hypothetical protein
VSDARSAAMTGSLRVLPWLLVEGRARVQNRNGSTDTIVGGGGILRINRSTNLAIRGAEAPTISRCERRPCMAEVRHYRGAIEMAASSATYRSPTST